MQQQLHMPLMYLLLAAATASDAASRRVPNAIPVAMTVLAVAAHLSAGGVRQAFLAGGAASLVLAVLLVPFSRRMLGGGDVKLAVACAAWLGFRGLPVFLLASAIAGGAVAVAVAVLALRAPAAAETGSQAGAATLRARLRSAPVPYSIAIAAGTVTAVHWGVP
jgi:prepilin peptidase CpaA